MSLRPVLVIALLVILLAFGCGHLLCAWMPGANPGLVTGDILLAFGALAHGSWLWGWKRSLTFFAFSSGLTFLLEALSLATGLATPYVYTAVLGPRLLGVPVVIPLGWFTMLYLSHIVVNLMVDGSPQCLRRGHGRVVTMALLTALVMSSWDLTMDPYMVHTMKAWVWSQPSGFLGIPFANFVSWMELTFIISLCFRVTERGLPEPDPKPRSRGWVGLPVVIYGVVGLSGSLLGLVGGLSVLPPFTMGIAALAALGRLKGGEA